MRKGTRVQKCSVKDETQETENETGVKLLICQVMENVQCMSIYIMYALYVCRQV